MPTTTADHDSLRAESLVSEAMTAAALNSVDSSLTLFGSLPSDDQDVVRDMLIEFFNAKDLESRREVAISIREFLSPADFRTSDAISLDAWADSDPDTRAAIDRLTQLKKEFGARLAELRAERGWRQEDLARELEVTQSTIAQFEAGKHKPQPRTLSRLAQAFGLEVENLWPMA